MSRHTDDFIRSLKQCEPVDQTVGVQPDEADRMVQYCGRLHAIFLDPVHGKDAFAPLVSIRHVETHTGPTALT